MSMRGYHEERSLRTQHGIQGLEEEEGGEVEGLEVAEEETVT